MEIDRARDKLEEAKSLFESEKSRLVLLTDALKAQMDLKRSEVGRLRAISAFQRERVASMTVRAGQVGVVQDIVAAEDGPRYSVLMAEGVGLLRDLPESALSPVGRG